MISFEYIGVLDSYFIHRYLIIKYRSSSITDKIHRLLSELWPLISEWKMVSGWYLLNTAIYDSYFIHRYIIIKYRSSSITGKIHQLLSELWPLTRYEKWFPGYIFWIHWWIGFIFHTQVYYHKIQVKFDYRQNPTIIIRVMALDLQMKNGFQAISFEYSNLLDSYFIHRYMVIKYRPSSITDKIHQLLSELWPLISVWKMVSRQYLLNTLVYWIHISYTGIWS